MRHVVYSRLQFMGSASERRANARYSDESVLPLPFQPGDLIGGRYRLIRMIGAGAMGAVWSARNESTDRDFALKLMLPDAATNPVALQRFFQEAKASGRLRHRCIVEDYDLGRI